LQIASSLQLFNDQAKSIKASVLDAKMSLAGTPNESDQSKRDRYEKEQEEIKSEAERKEAAAKSNFHKHEVFARGVTMFQIAIAIAAISALTRTRKFWIVSLLFGGVGCVFLALAELGEFFGSVVQKPLGSGVNPAKRSIPARSPDKAALAEPREVASHPAPAGLETERFNRFGSNVRHCFVY
jgi:Domain of unknown function (DUF4337)